MRFKRFLACLMALCLCVLAVPSMGDSAQAAMPYYIEVDITNQIVTVYENSNRTTTGIVHQMICSTGASGHSTPTGVFTLPTKRRATERTEWYSFPVYGCYAKWATRIRGGILFHSVLFNRRGGNPTPTSVAALGRRASHGCVRLRVDDAKWIALKCGAGTQCKIYYSGRVNSDLRTRLLKKSFDRSNETYNHFLGKADDLRYGSTGAKVKQLQTRLRALGYFTGEIGGNFLTLTKTAVVAFQKDAGLKRDGVVTAAVWKKIFSSSAPTGTKLTLTEGFTGPAALTLQRALTVAKCYSGKRTSVIDAKTINAVKKWQRVQGLTETGKITPALQRKIIAFAAELKSRFGSQAYVLVKTSTKTPMVRVTALSAPLYEEASTSSTVTARLSNGATAKVLIDDGEWIKVQSGAKIGWLKPSKVERYDGSYVTYEYKLASEAGALDGNGVPEEPLPEEGLIEPEIEEIEGDGLSIEAEEPAVAFEADDFAEIETEDVETEDEAVIEEADAEDDATEVFVEIE